MVGDIGTVFRYMEKVVMLPEAFAHVVVDQIELG